MICGHYHCILTVKMSKYHRKNILTRTPGFHFQVIRSENLFKMTLCSQVLRLHTCTSLEVQEYVSALTDILLLSHTL